MSHAEGVVEVIARGVCVQEGLLLVCHTAGSSNTYLPGGHVEFRERAVDSLAREIQEECGLAGQVGRFLGGIEHAFLQKGVPHAEINLVFELTIPALSAGKPVPAVEAHLDFQWLALDRLAEGRLEPRVLCDLIPAWSRGDYAVTWASWCFDTGAPFGM